MCAQLKRTSGFENYLDQTSHAFDISSQVPNLFMEKYLNCQMREICFLLHDLFPQNYSEFKSSGSPRLILARFGKATKKNLNVSYSKLK